MNFMNYKTNKQKKKINNAPKFPSKYLNDRIFKIKHHLNYI